MAPTERPRPAGRRTPLWIILLFWLGSAVPLVLGLTYLVAWVAPSEQMVQLTGATAAQLRVTAGVATIYCTVLLVVQLVAALGLTLARDWARPVASVACALWTITCIGIPVCVAVLTTIWGRGRTPRPL